jgi:hypothetical protein
MSKIIEKPKAICKECVNLSGVSTLGKMTTARDWNCDVGRILTGYDPVTGYGKYNYAKCHFKNRYGDCMDFKSNRKEHP